MAIGIIFDAKDLTAEQYEQVRDETTPNGAMPKGMLYHAAGPTTGGWNVVEIWESEADARQFFDDKLGEALARAHVSVQPRFFEVRHTLK